ncbi:MAG: R3H domain-containing nucleic acid-binding protein [Patescibacteria group bacterium]
MIQAEIQNLIREVLEKVTLPAQNISIEEGKPGESAWFSVEVSEPHYFLARGGEGLSALNHLIRKITESRSGDTEVGEILVDIGGFQKKRIESVRAIAHMMAERARYFKSNIEIDPMPAFERRIVHEFLSGEKDLKTESEGTGATRRVIIKYLGDPGMTI